MAYFVLVARKTNSVTASLKKLFLWDSSWLFLLSLSTATPLEQQRNAKQRKMKEKGSKNGPCFTVVSNSSPLSVTRHCFRREFSNNLHFVRGQKMFHSCFREWVEFFVNRWFVFNSIWNARTPCGPWAIPLPSFSPHFPTSPPSTAFLYILLFPFLTRFIYFLGFSIHSQSTRILLLHFQAYDAVGCVDFMFVVFLVKDACFLSYLI